MIRLEIEHNQKVYQIDVHPNNFLSLRKTGNDFEITIGTTTGEPLPFPFDLRELIDSGASIGVVFLFNQHLFEGEAYPIICEYQGVNVERLTISGSVKRSLRIAFGGLGVNAWGSYRWERDETLLTLGTVTVERLMLVLWSLGVRSTHLWPKHPSLTLT